jgi:Rrf2 family transcriptional regulator, iron-sulfur cluster assembly transcription factor
VPDPIELGPDPTPCGRDLFHFMNRETFLRCAPFTFVTLLSHKALLAIAAVVDVALQEGRQISAKANRQGAAPRSFEPLLRSLVHQGILKGTRGPHGGYELTRDRSAVTLNDVPDALDVGEPKDQPKSETVTTIVLPVLSLAEQAFAKALSNQMRRKSAQTETALILEQSAD